MLKNLTCSDVRLEDDKDIDDIVKLSNPDLRQLELMVDHEAHHDPSAEVPQRKVQHLKRKRTYLIDLSATFSAT